LQNAVYNKYEHFRKKVNTPQSLPQRVFAAFFAISLRRLAVMPSARAFPPIRPSATAAAFVPSSVVRFVNLARGNPADHDGVADGVGEAFRL
jgi:hypothetical protein